MNENTNKLLGSSRIERLAALLIAALALFVGLLVINQVIGLFEAKPAMGNLITVQGEGRVTVVPDIATISFTVTQDATTASVAQDAAAKKVNVAIAVAKNLGVEEKDVKTTSYSISPKYNTPQPCYAGYCPSYEQRVVGYTASQTIELRVRETDDAGKILSSLGDAGVSNLYGPSFTVDDMDAVREDAREKAIMDARKKAKTLAKDLGVSIVRVASFYESGGPIYYGYGKAEAGMGGDSRSLTTPEIPPGENEVVVSVSVSYEIR